MQISFCSEYQNMNKTLLTFKLSIFSCSAELDAPTCRWLGLLLLFPVSHISYKTQKSDPHPKSNSNTRATPKQHQSNTTATQVQQQNFRKQSTV